MVMVDVLIEMRKPNIMRYIGQHLAALIGTFLIFTVQPIVMVNRWADRSGYTQSGHEYAGMNLFMTAIAIVMIAALMTLICGTVAVAIQLLRRKASFSRWVPLLLAALALASMCVARAVSMPDTAQALLRPMWGCVAFALYWLILLGLGYGKTRNLENQNKSLQHIREQRAEGALSPEC